MSGLQAILNPALPLDTYLGDKPSDTVQCSFEFRMTHMTQMRLPEARAPINKPPEAAPGTTVPQVI